ncbi:hypothetical protein D0T87_15580 [Bacteroides sp. 51]|nr:hypothetical protein [Bacteroides sp. 51]
MVKNQMNEKFKLELDMAYPHIGIFSKYFNSLKSLKQWLKRNKNSLFTCIETREYIFTNNGYERFYIFGNTLVPLSELSKITSDIIKNEEDKQKFIDELKTQSIQKTISEECESSKQQK